MAPEEMSRYKMSWSEVLALVAVDPEITSQRSDAEQLKKAVPEVVKTQPRGIYREVIFFETHP